MREFDPPLLPTPEPGPVPPAKPPEVPPPEVPSRQNLHRQHRSRYLHHEPLCQPHLVRNLRFCSGRKNPLCSAKSHRHWDQSDCLRRCRQECSMFLNLPHCQFRFQSRLFLLLNQSLELLQEFPRQSRFPNLSLHRLIRLC